MLVMYKKYKEEHKMSNKTVYHPVRTTFSERMKNKTQVEFKKWFDKGFTGDWKAAYKKATGKEAK